MTRDYKYNLEINSTRRRGLFRRNIFTPRLISVLCTLCVLAVGALNFTTSAHEGEDHSQPAQKKNAPASPAVSVLTSERNINTDAGSFRARLRQAPVDPRAGETAQFEIELIERIEGGFGGADGQPVTAVVTARIMTATGQIVAGNLATHAEGEPPRPGVYGVEYQLPASGNYKIFFDARTEDGRAFAVDFPVSVTHAPTNPLFWIGLAMLALVSLGAIYGRYRSYNSTDAGQEETSGASKPSIASALRKTVPVAVAALLFFAVGTVALAYFSPPRERRTIAHLPADGGGTSSAGDPALGGSGATLTIPKESQQLFDIRTAVVEERQIVSGLKTSGVVRAKPDARAVISPPVAGRVTLNGNITIGAAIGRGQTIGSVEQVLGASEQAALEGQRIGLRTAALEQQSRVSEQQSLAAQARTRLTQAQRELLRAKNLFDVGAASRKRVEEAQTAVSLAQQEVSNAEAQARAAGQQARLARESVASINPVRKFPLIAPVSGIVTDLRVVTGQQVEAGAELMNLVNLTTVLLEARVFERDLAAARDSGRATYTAPALNGEVYTIGVGDNSDAGRLVSIGQSVDPQTRTVPVIYEVTNPLNRLREGMFIEITLDTSGGARVLTVPKGSVTTEQGRAFVFVFKGGETFERRVVVLGAEGQDYYEVRSGVKSGERVVTEGIYQLRSTQPG